jgi:hypothetical protein
MQLVRIGQWLRMRPKERPRSRTSRPGRATGSSLASAAVAAPIPPFSHAFLATPVARDPLAPAYCPKKTPKQVPWNFRFDALLDPDNHPFLFTAWCSFLRRVLARRAGSVK